jgi:hypothetical protein
MRQLCNLFCFIVSSVLSNGEVFDEGYPILQIVFEAAWALTNIVSGSREQVRELRGGVGVRVDV